MQILGEKRIVSASDLNDRLAGGRFRVDGLEGFDFNYRDPVRTISLTFLDLADGFGVPDRPRPAQPSEDSVLQGPDPATIQIDRLVWEETGLKFADFQG